MQNSHQKKKSVFSQRIKQARQKQQQTSSASFPKALKVQTEQQGNKEHVFETKKIQEERFIDRILKSQLKNDQIQSIQKDNFNSIKNMSQQQIRKYQQLIIKEMPIAFLQKLAKNRSRINALKEERMQHQTLMVEQKQMEISQKINQNQENEDENCNQYQQQTGKMGSLQPLCLDIQKMKIKNYYEHIETGKQQIVTMSALNLMISSENNQTQIVGSKLLSQFCKSLSEYSKGFQGSMVMIQGQWFHRTMIVQDIFKYLITSLMKQIKKTNFKSCWIQMMLNLLKCLDLIGDNLAKINDGQQIKLISEFLKTQIPKIQMFDLHNSKRQNDENNYSENVLNLSKTIQRLQNQSQVKQRSCSEILNLVKKSPFEIIQQLRMQLIEYSSKEMRYQFLSFLQKVYKQTQIQFQGKQDQQKDYILELVYVLSLQLLLFDYKTNRMNHEFDIVKQSLYSWVRSIVNSKYLLPNLAYFKSFRDQKQEESVFKCLMITKILSHESYTRLLDLDSEQTNNNQIKKQVYVENQKLANILTYMNIDEYFNPNTKIQTDSQKEAQTENINKMLMYIDHKLGEKQENYIKSICEIAFANLLAIFQSDMQNPSQSYKAQKIQLSYNDINQDILDSTVARLCEIVITRKLEAKLWSIIPEEKVKSLISSYNYNSFGNYTFTKLLLFLAVCCPNSNTQVMIIEEVMSRYPFLFLYASQSGLYGSPSIYIQGRRLQELSGIYDILTSVKPVDETNMFVRYLLKK